MESTPNPQNSQMAPNNTNNNTTNTTLDAIDQAIAVNNIVTQANNIINRTTVDATKSIFEYTLKGNPYLYTIKQEFHFNDDFINLLKEETVRIALSEENIQRIVKDAVMQPEDQKYILENHKPLDQIAEDGCMTYEQFLILSFLISHAAATSDRGLTMNLKKAQQIVETGAKQINEKQQTLQKVGSVVGDVSIVIGIIGSALTLSRIFWTAMPAGLFYVSLAIAITFSLYTLVTRLINLYRSSQMQKNSAEIDRLSKLAQQMKNTFIDKVKNAQQKDINNEREQWKAERKNLENQSFAVQQNIAHLQQVKLQQQQSLQQTQKQNEQLLEMHKQNQRQIQQIQQENAKLQAAHEQDQKTIEEKENNLQGHIKGLNASMETINQFKQQLNAANGKIKEQEETIQQLTNKLTQNEAEFNKLNNQNKKNKNKNNHSNKDNKGNSNANQDSDDDELYQDVPNLFKGDSEDYTKNIMTTIKAKNNTLNQNNQPKKQNQLNKKSIKSITKHDANTSNKNKSSNGKNKVLMTNKQFQNEIEEKFQPKLKTIKHKNNKFNLKDINEEEMSYSSSSGGD